jgi:VanZ family protein
MRKEKVGSSTIRIARRVVKFWLPVAAWAVFIFLLSSYPTRPVVEIYWKDFIVKKSAHVVEYAILTILLYRALKESGIERKKAGVYSVILAVLYGVSDEFHQSFTPGRDPKARDVFFDTIGSVAGIYLIWRLLPKAPKRLRKWAERLQLT